MKRLRKYLLLFVLSFFAYTNAFAETELSVGDTLTMARPAGTYSVPGISGVRYQNGADLSYYYLAYKDGTEYKLFCLDPGMNTPKSLLVDATVTDGKYYDAKEGNAILAIYNSDVSGFSGEQAEFLRNFAVRIFNNLLGKTRGYTGEWSARWMKNQLSGTSSKICNEIHNSSFSCPSASYETYSISDEYYNAIKGLVAKGIEAYVGSGGAAEDGSSTSGAIDVSLSSSTDSGDSKLKVVEFRLKDLDKVSTPKFEYDGVIEGEATLIGYSFTNASDEGSFRRLPSGNILESSEFRSQISGGSITFYLAFKVPSSSGDESGSNKATIAYSYSDPNGGGAVIIVNNEGNGFAYQNYIARGTGGSGTFVIGDDEEKCPPYNELPQICGPGAPIEDGLAVYNFKEGLTKEHELNIKKCILKNTDVAGNSYQLKDVENADRVIDNPYCEIYCKEDYKLYMPYRSSVESGRYFQMSVAIKGREDCYSTRINEEQYEQDVRTATKNIVDAYNEWQKYYELVNYVSGRRTESNMTCSSEVTSCSYHSYTDPETGDFYDWCSSSTTAHDPNGKYWHYSFTEQYFQHNWASNKIIPTSWKPGSETWGELRHTTNSCGSPSSCPISGSYVCQKVKEGSDDYNQQRSNYVSNEASYRQQVKDLVQRLKQIIDQYNSCVGSSSQHAASNSGDLTYWDLVYLYDPEIKYSYAEPDPTNYSNSKWINEVSANGFDVMPASIKNVSGASEEYCKGDIENDYTCKTGATGSPEYENVTFDYLWPDEGKKTFDSDVNRSKYVHRFANADSKHITQRVYYQNNSTGLISISAESDDWPEDTTQIKGLPVGADTPQGTYFKIISINNLGTYYDITKLGRIYGVDSTSLSNFMREEEGVQSYSVGGEVNTSVLNNVPQNAYACTYTVNDVCTDREGQVHKTDECNYAAGETTEQCFARVCQATTHCVKKNEGGQEKYYVCSSKYFSDGSCLLKSSKKEAVEASDDVGNCQCESALCPRCTTCDIRCEGKSCISGLNLNFRVITPSNLNPNDRYLGFNWDQRQTVNVLVAQKARDTINEIEKHANIDINTATDAQIEAIDAYSLKVTMTPNMVSWIKNYNKVLEKDGSYTSSSSVDTSSMTISGRSSLKCYDYTLEGSYSKDSCEANGYSWKNVGGTGKCVMTDLFCYSTFIDSLISEFPDKVDEPTGNREHAKTNANTNWTTYNSLYCNSDSCSVSSNLYTDSYWTIYKFVNLDINGDTIPDAGPSWK